MCLCDAQDVDKNITYHPIIILSNLRNMDKMIEIENIMRENGFPAQYETLNALLQGYAKTGRLEDINRMKALIEAGESEKLKNFFDILVSEHSNTAAVISFLQQALSNVDAGDARDRGFVEGHRWIRFGSQRHLLLSSGCLLRTEPEMLWSSDTNSRMKTKSRQ